MGLCRTTFARAFLLLGMCAWVAGSFAASIHHVLVQHVVCAEHGEVVELDADSDAASVARSSGPELRSAAPDPAHDDGCSFDVVSLQGIAIAPPAMVSLRVIHWPDVAPLAIAGPPRGPPLAYAPKNSPPQTC